MAPLCRAASTFCLAALAGLQSAAAETPQTYKFEAVKVGDNAYLAANLARNGKLAVHINEVTEDESLVTSLSKKVVGTDGGIEAKAEVTGESCEALIKTLKLEDMFRHSFSYQDSPNYPELLQAALDAGLEVFQNEYPSQWETIWQSPAGANLAYLLGSNSTKIGCVIGKCTQVQAAGSNPDRSQERVAESRISSEGTASTDSVLFCQLDPAATKNQAPFDKEYFNALVSRTTKLTDMTAEDLKAPANDATAAAAMPTILVAGLFAMLATVSA